MNTILLLFFALLTTATVKADFVFPSTEVVVLYGMETAYGNGQEEFDTVEIPEGLFCKDIQVSLDAVPADAMSAAKQEAMNNFKPEDKKAEVRARYEVNGRKVYFDPDGVTERGWGAANNTPEDMGSIIYDFLSWPDRCYLHARYLYQQDIHFVVTEPFPYDSRKNSKRQ